MWKFVGGSSYVLGLPMVDIADSDWRDYPAELRELARKTKLYEHVDDGDDKPEPAPKPAPRRDRVRPSRATEAKAAQSTVAKRVPEVRAVESPTNPAPHTTINTKDAEPVVSPEKGVSDADN